MPSIHRIAAMAATVLIAGAFAGGQTTKSASPAEMSQEKLKKIVKSANYDAADWNELIQTFSKEWQVGIDIEWDELAKAGIDTKLPVTTRARNIQRDKLLTIVVRRAVAPANGGALGDPANWVMQPNGRILITTSAKVIARDEVEKRYQLRDLVGDERISPKEVPQGSQQLFGGSGGENGGVGGPGGSLSLELQDAVLKLIIETVQPGTWAKAPGKPGGTARFEGSTLVVKHLPDTHREIDNLLEKIRPNRPPRKPLN